MMLFWTILLVLILVMLFRLVPNARSTTEERSPLQQLQRRYAAGELTTREYDERRRRL